MVVDEYLQKVKISVEPLRSLVPENTLVLFESLAEPDEDCVAFSECYLLVAKSNKSDKKYLPVREPLFLHASNGVSQQGRQRAISNWLRSSVRKPFYPAYDFVEEKMMNGQPVFFPNRFPDCYKYYGGEISFLGVLSNKKTADG